MELFFPKMHFSIHFFWRPVSRKVTVTLLGVSGVSAGYVAAVCIGPVKTLGFKAHRRPRANTSTVKKRQAAKRRVNGFPLAFFLAGCLTAITCSLLCT